MKTQSDQNITDSPERVARGSSSVSGSVWTFAKQHRQCRENGTKSVMTSEKYGQLPPAAQQEAEQHRKFWNASDHTGLGFCEMQPGVCSLKHCRKIGNVKV